MSQTCQECGAKCCKYFSFEIDEPDDFDEFEDIRWFLCHQGVGVHVDEGDWYIEIDSRCEWLGDDNQCTNYEDRPLICRKYSGDNCDHSGGDYGYDEHFHTPEKIEAYARKTLGDKVYDRERKKAYAKLEPKPPRMPKKKGTK